MISNRQLLVEFATDIIWNAGLFGGLYNKKPAKNRWGTMNGACAANSCAKMVHGIGGRVILHTWHHALKPPPPGLESDFHFAMKSKLHRLVRKQGILVQDLKHCAVSFTATPLDHLLQKIQRPSKDGILTDLLSKETNPFLQCQLDLGDTYRPPVRLVQVGRSTA